MFNLFLKSRTMRLAGVCIATILFLFSGFVIYSLIKTFNDGPSHLDEIPTEYFVYFGLSALLFILSVWGFFVLLFSRSPGEIEAADRDNASRHAAYMEEVGWSILESLKEACRKLEENFNFNQGQTAKEFFDKSAYFTADYLGDERLKILLNGIANNLGLIYLDINRLTKKTEEHIRLKLDGWESEVLKILEVIEDYEELKKEFQAIYKRIEASAKKCSVELVPRDSSGVNYLTYASPHIIKLIEKPD